MGELLNPEETKNYESILLQRSYDMASRNIEKQKEEIGKKIGLLYRTEGRLKKFISKEANMIVSELNEEKKKLGKYSNIRRYTSPYFFSCWDRFVWPMESEYFEKQVNELERKIKSVMSLVRSSVVTPKVQSQLISSCPVKEKEYLLEEYLRLYLRNHLETMSLAVSPNGKVFTGGSDGGVIVRKDEKLLFENTLKTLKNSIAILVFSNEFDYLGVAGNAFMIEIWKISQDYKKVCTLQGHTNSVTSILFSKNDKFLVSSGLDFSVLLWDYIHSDTPFKAFAHKNAILCMANFGVEEFILGGKEKHLFLRKFSNAKNEDVIFEHKDTIRVATSWKEKIIAAGKKIFIWEAEKKLKKLKKHQKKIQYLIVSQSFDKTKDILISAGQDSFIVVWDLETCEIESIFRHSSPVTSILYSKKIQYLYSSSEDLTIKTWDLSSYQLRNSISTSKTPIFLSLSSTENDLIVVLYPNTLQSFPIPLIAPKHSIIGHTKKLKSILLISENCLATTGDSNILFWNLLNRTVEGIFNSHSDDVLCLAITPNQKYLISGGNDQIVKVWETSTKRPCGEVTWHTGKISALACTDEFVFSASSGKIIVWDLLEKKKQQELVYHEGEILSLHISGDKSKLVSIGSDQKIVIWNPYKSQKIQVIEKDEERLDIKFVCFSRDNSYFSFLINDKNLFVYDFSPVNKISEISSSPENIKMRPDLYAFLYMVRKND